LNLHESVRQAYEAFLNQLDIEIVEVQRLATTETEAVRQLDDRHRQHVQQLHQVNLHIEGIEDLDDEALVLLRDSERLVTSTEHHQLLAKERELLANESLNDLQETRQQADRRFGELEDEFAQAQSDLGLLQEIARNDWMIVTREQRKVILDRYRQRRPITASENRQLVTDLMDRIRQRQTAWAADQRTPEDPSVAEARARVQAFLTNLPVVDAIEPETLPDESEAIPD
jgi:hypothetical protein